MPKLQPDKTRSEFALVMSAKIFDKQDRRVRLLVAIKKRPVLQALDDVFV